MTPAGSAPLRVMAHPVAARTDIQPYTALLYEAIARLEVVVEPYRTWRSLTDPPHIIHIHWPEHVLARRRLRKVMRAFILLASLVVARARGSVLVYTAHNALPHDLELTGFDRWFISAFDRKVDLVLALSMAGLEAVREARPGLAASPVAHTRHADFAAVYPACGPDPAPHRTKFGIEPDRTTLVFAGQVRRYKGVLELLDAAADLDVDVLVAGNCDDLELRRELVQRERQDPRVHLHLAALTPAELSSAIGAATLVVLPYRQVLNSGSAMLALSLQRPVLVPGTPTFHELAREVGPRWVHCARALAITSSDVAAALLRPPAGQPDLAAYTWPEVAAATLAAYRSVAVNALDPKRRSLWTAARRSVSRVVQQPHGLTGLAVELHQLGGRQAVPPTTDGAGMTLRDNSEGPREG